MYKEFCDTALDVDAGLGLPSPVASQSNVSQKSLISESYQTQLSVELIKMGARIQMLQSEFTLSKDRLYRIYREVKGKSPPKGMHPFSVDWYMVWKNRINSSVFLSIYKSLDRKTDKAGLALLLTTYKLYLEYESSVHGDDALVMEPSGEGLTLTRAWTLIRFEASGLLKMKKCEECETETVCAIDSPPNLTCPICTIPNRIASAMTA